MSPALAACLVAATLVLVLAVVLVLAAVRRRTEPSCTWCSQRSGWPVRGHDTLHCRGFVHHVRERHPDYGGNLWRDPATPSQ